VSVYIVYRELRGCRLIIRRVETIGNCARSCETANREVTHLREMLRGKDRELCKIVRDSES